jgi:hypothetical protein
MIMTDVKTFRGPAIRYDPNDKEKTKCGKCKKERRPFWHGRYDWLSKHADKKKHYWTCAVCGARSNFEDLNLPGLC